jgi:uncharacterized protein (DUF2062 family)
LKGRQSPGHLRTIPALQRLRRWVRFRLVIPVIRSRQSAEYTARGVANGVFWALTPTVGLQTAEIVATWFLARKVLRADSSLVQALVWVWVNNPITMVPMYYAFYLTGLWLTGAPGAATGYEAFLRIWDRPDAGWVELVSHAAATIGLPTMIGCIPYAAIGSATSYRWAYAIVRRRQLRFEPGKAL